MDRRGMVSAKWAHTPVHGGYKGRPGRSQSTHSPGDLPCVRAQGLEMKSLLLTVLLLGLVALLKAQEAPPDDQEDVSGIWYIKATVSDKNHKNGKRPMKAFPMNVTALEGGDLEVKITFWRKGHCHVKKILLQKTDEPHKYTAFNNKKVIYILQMPVDDHYIFYCESQRKGKTHRKGKLVGRDPKENPEAMEEFKKFVKSKGFKEENIFVPEQLDQCEDESD